MQFNYLKLSPSDWKKYQEHYAVLLNTGMSRHAAERWALQLCQSTSFGAVNEEQS